MMENSALREALRKAIFSAIDELGTARLKEMEMFMSSRKRKIELPLAA